jgi:hypothetical protein
LEDLRRNDYPKEIQAKPFTMEYENNPRNKKHLIPHQKQHIYGFEKELLKELWNMRLDVAADQFGIKKPRKDYSCAVTQH